MKGFATTMALLLSTAALAGCAQPDGGDDDDVGGGAAQVTAVMIGQPAAPENGTSEVCWTVEGSGTIPHTALHWDDESHADEDVTFEAYDGGLVYPDGDTTAAPDGYDLPGTFCAPVPVPTTGERYVVAHAMVDAPGALSEEVVVEGAVPLDAYTLTTTGVPEEVEAGENFTFTLAVVGPPGTTTHLGAHYGRNASDAPTTDAYPNACAHHANATLPGTFTVTCAIPEPGTWHLRGHMIHNGTHYWAEDRAIVVTGEAAGAGNVTAVRKPYLTGLTGTVGTVAGDNATVCWVVEGTGTIPHVAVHYDNESHAGEDVTFAAYDLGASYPDNMTAEEFADASFELAPDGATFCTNVPRPPTGNQVWLVGHAMVTAPGRISQELQVTFAPV